MKTGIILSLALAGCNQILGIGDVVRPVADAPEVDAALVADAPQADAPEPDGAQPDGHPSDARPSDARPVDSRPVDAQPVDAMPPPDAACLCTGFYVPTCDLNGCRCVCNNAFECGNQIHACE